MKGWPMKYSYRYTCDKTGLTYSTDGWNNTPENVEKVNQSKIEVPCSVCGGMHVLFIVQQ